ncbi:MAG TPA: response regulator transcription factor [Verrucomicrobiae bacterium]|nr:response regulator transcription factor [Verrucomicrobiae bacterium]
MQEKEVIRVVIADDHTVVREGLRAIIDNDPTMKVIGEARDWPDAIRTITSRDPEIALLDVRMPGMNAAEGVSAIRQRCARTGVILLSAFDRDEEIYEVVRAGAKGFLLKDCTRMELRACIRAVHQGETFLAPVPAAKLAARIQSPDLSGRQVQILGLVVEGKTNKEVGALLNITEGTVKVHMSHIFERLAVDGRMAAITKALQRGIVRLPKSA